MSAAGLPAPHPWPKAPPREEFRTDKLGPVWSTVRSPLADKVSLTERRGFLRLKGSEASIDDVASPTLVVQPQRHHEVRIATELHIAAEAGQRAGLVVRGNEDNHFDLLVEGRKLKGNVEQTVVFATRIGGKREEVARHPLPAGKVILSLEGHKDHYEFFCEPAGGERTSLGRAPTTPFAYEKTQSFTGAFVGLYAHSDRAQNPTLADFAWFDYAPLPGGSCADYREQQRNPRLSVGSSDWPARPLHSRGLLSQPE
jgi:alpha-N-arabinofuranosidase